MENNYVFVICIVLALIVLGAVFYRFIKRKPHQDAIRTDVPKKSSYSLINHVNPSVSQDLRTQNIAETLQSNLAAMYAQEEKQQSQTAEAKAEKPLEPVKQTVTPPKVDTTLGVKVTANNTANVTGDTITQQKIAAENNSKDSDSKASAAESYFGKSYTVTGKAKESAIEQTNKTLAKKEFNINQERTIATDNINDVYKTREQKRLQQELNPERELSLAEERKIANKELTPQVVAKREITAKPVSKPVSKPVAKTATTEANESQDQASLQALEQLIRSNPEVYEKVLAFLKSKNTGTQETSSLVSTVTKAQQAEARDKEQKVASPAGATPPPVTQGAAPDLSAVTNASHFATNGIRVESPEDVAKAVTGYQNLAEIARKRSQPSTKEPEEVKVDPYVETDPVILKLNTLFENPEQYIVFKVKNQRSAEISAVRINNILRNLDTDFNENSVNYTTFVGDRMRLSYNNVWRPATSSAKEVVIYHLFNEFGQWIGENEREEYKYLYLYVSRRILQNDEALSILITQLTKLCNKLSAYLDLRGTVFSTRELCSYPSTIRNQINQVLKQGDAVRHSSRYS
ncbi:hypothetical protein [Psittacicella gerlachiana]|uniref:Uncharacterized protein n=1 Tax=Psittacicella gerlachiana TaxID=2028574 RepID=A0A3A1YI48_9GAMM|nr:hypothetical protein [Psittacicella gerlachiana]RIY37933.1 hypothetical protein CKF59_01215 [Psittacicella gerlachiana]